MDGISPTAVVKADKIGKNVTIGEFAVIREGVEIGDLVPKVLGDRQHLASPRQAERSSSR